MDEITQVLALVLGAYFIIAGLGVVARRKVLPEFITRFREDPVLSFIGGVLALWLGLVILALHWKWDDAIAAGVTLIGVIAALKGALLIIFGPSVMVLARPFDENLHLASLWGGLVTVIGVALVIAGALAPAL